MPGTGYAITCQEAAVTSALQTVGDLVRGAGVRGVMTEFTLSQGGVPEDTTVRWEVARHTTANTITAVVTRPVNPGDPDPGVMTAGQGATIEGTYTASGNLFDMAINVRAAYRWVTQPNRGLMVPDAAANGIGVRIIQGSASYAGVADASIFFDE